MYDSSDPRSALAVTGSATAPIRQMANADVVRFYDAPADEVVGSTHTWFARGQHFIVAYSEAAAGNSLSRGDQPDEYVLILPASGASVEVEAGSQTTNIPEGSIAFIPPGASNIRVISSGRLIRLFTTRSNDLIGRCANAQSYTDYHTQVAQFESWPEPTGGYKIRHYKLDVAPEANRFGRIWRCSTFMINYFYPDGPRNPNLLSPHHHDDFEQCSLALEGEFIHHLRWPWITNSAQWREDAHEICQSPSIVVIPPPAIHTTQATGKQNLLVDIFCPPRIDFSEKEGWVLNASDYPMRSRP